MSQREEERDPGKKSEKDRWGSKGQQERGSGMEASGRVAHAGQVPKGPEEAETQATRSVKMKGTRRREWRAGQKKEVQRRREGLRQRQGRDHRRGRGRDTERQRG